MKPLFPKSARGLRFVAFVLFTAGNASSLVGQTMAADQGELERLRTENQQLRVRLEEAEAKLKAVPATPTPTWPSWCLLQFLPGEDHAEQLVSQRLLNQMYLRKTVFSEEVLNPANNSRPAQFTFEHSGNGSDHYAIDTGVAVELDKYPIVLSGAQIVPGIGVDYHRNSSSDSAKNLLQAGALADSFLGDPAQGNFFANVKGNITFKDDEKKDVKSVAGGWDFLPVEKRIFRIDDWHDFGVLRWRWQPFAGLRGAVSGDVPDGVNNGHQLLARYGLESDVFPLYSFANLKESVETTLNLTAWSDISSSGVYRSKSWRGYLDFELNYWFYGGPNRKKNRTSLGFGLGYEKGDDPDSDQADVDLLTLSLKAKF